MGLRPASLGYRRQVDVDLSRPAIDIKSVVRMGSTCAPPRFPLECLS